MGERERESAGAKRLEWAAGQQLIPGRRKGAIEGRRLGGKGRFWSPQKVRKKKVKRERKIGPGSSRWGERVPGQGQPPPGEDGETALDLQKVTHSNRGRNEVAIEPRGP